MIEPDDPLPEVPVARDSKPLDPPVPLLADLMLTDPLLVV
jgi:hypothetical protein